MKKVATYTHADGRIAVMHFPEARDQAEAESLAQRFAPAGVALAFVDVAQLPASRTWRDAWCCDGKGVPSVNLERARPIAHERRRRMRAEQFAPHDAVIALQIPGADAAAAEAAREAIRTRNAQAQTQIDQAASVADLEAALAVAKGGA